MKNSRAAAIAAALSLLPALPLAAQTQVLGTDAAASEPNGAGHAALVRETPFKDLVGKQRLK